MNELAHYKPPPPPALDSVPELLMVADHMVKSGFYREITNPSAAFALLLRAQAEGVHPGLALAQYHVIEGKPTLRADAMHARFIQIGGRVEWHVSSDVLCDATFTRPNQGSIRIRKSLDDMKRAGIAIGRNGQLKDNYAKFPGAMLRARVISEGVRAVAPDVVVGLYTPEEIRDSREAEGCVQAEAKAIPALDQTALTTAYLAQATELHEEIRAAFAAAGASDLQVQQSLRSRGVNAIEDLTLEAGTSLLVSIRARIEASKLKRELSPTPIPAEATTEAEYVVPEAVRPDHSETKSS